MTVRIRKYLDSLIARLYPSSLDFEATKNILVEGDIRRIDGYAIV